MLFQEPCNVALQPLDTSILEYPEDPVDDPPEAVWDALEPWSEENGVQELIWFYFNEFQQRVGSKSDIAYAFHFRVLGNEFSFADAMRFIYDRVKYAFNVSAACTVLLRKQATETEEQDQFMIFFGQVSIHDTASNVNFMRFNILGSLWFHYW